MYANAMLHKTAGLEICPVGTGVATTENEVQRLVSRCVGVCDWAISSGIEYCTGSSPLSSPIFGW